MKVRAYAVATRLANLGWEFWKTGTEAEKQERKLQMEKTHEEGGQKGVLSCHCSDGEDLKGSLRLLYPHVQSTAS